MRNGTGTKANTRVLRLPAARLAFLSGIAAVVAAQGGAGTSVKARSSPLATEGADASGVEPKRPTVQHPGSIIDALPPILVDALKRTDSETGPGPIVKCGPLFGFFLNVSDSGPVGTSVQAIKCRRYYHMLQAYEERLSSQTGPSPARLS